MKTLVSLTFAVFSFLNVTAQTPFWNTLMDSIAHPSSKWGWIIFKDSVDIGPEELFTDFGDAFGMTSADTMGLYDVSTDNLGYTRHKYQQHYKGIEVFGARYFVHSLGGRSLKANGFYIDSISLNTNPSVAEATALDSAFAYLTDSFGNVTYPWALDGGDSSHFPVGKLLIVNSNPNDHSASNYVLAWQFEVPTVAPSNFWKITVSATSGAVMKMRSTIVNCQGGTACTGVNGNQNINTTYYQETNRYSLIDDCRGGGIRTLEFTSNNKSLQTQPDGLYGERITNPSSNDWTTKCENNTIHWATEMFYDYLKELFGRNSFDGYGTAMNNYIATASGSAFEGAGFATAYIPHAIFGFVKLGEDHTQVASLDVVGHEWMHAVDFSNGEFLAGDWGNTEAYALGESFADIFGTLLEFYAEDLYDPYNSGDWDIGEDFFPANWGGKLRDMANPHTKNNPDTYLGTYWDANCYTAPFVGEPCDDGHNRCGVQNKWFYLLSEGGTGTNNHPTDPRNYTVNGIGKHNAGAIAFRNLMTYLTHNSTYHDARLGSIWAAIDLFGECSDEVLEVVKAWDAVGVYDDPDVCMYLCIKVDCYDPINRGAATARVVGGSAPYTYSWNDPGSQTTVTATNLPLGGYIVTVTDNGSCSAIMDVVIKDADDPLAVTTDVTEVYCLYNKGTAVAIVQGGVPPFHYQWDDLYLRRAQMLHHLDAATYNVTVSDKSGCSSSATANVAHYNISHPGATTITANTTWNNKEFEFTGQLIIESGVTLNVQNSKLKFAELGQNKMNVIIEPGASMIVLNSELSGYTECGTMWNGILVEGIGYYKQEDPLTTANPDHGFLYLRGSGGLRTIVRDARRGIMVGDPIHWAIPFTPKTNYAGGILFVQNTDFINNRRSIQFARLYHMNLSFIDGSTFSSDFDFLDKVSYFRNLKNTRIIDNEMNKIYISIAESPGITISNSHFTHFSRLLIGEEPLSGKAITAYNSGMTIYPQNWFENLDTAIELRGQPFRQFVPEFGILPFRHARYQRIEDNFFVRNKAGIIIAAPDYLDISYNSFEIPEHFNGFPTYGIFKKGRGFTKIGPGNTFAGSFDQFAGSRNYGVVIDRSSKDYAIVYNNSFSKTKYGLQVQGSNPALIVRCNNFAADGNPHYSHSWTNVLDNFGRGALKNQGNIKCDNVLYSNAAAGNQWNDLCTATPSDRDIYVEDEAQFNFEYYAHERDFQGFFTTLPDCSPQDWLGLGPLHYYTCATTKGQYDCTPHFPGLPEAPNSQDYEDYIDTIGVLVSEYLALNEQRQSAYESAFGAEADSLRREIENTRMDILFLENEALHTLFRYADSVPVALLHTMHSLPPKQLLAEYYLALDSTTLATQMLDTIGKLDTTGEAIAYAALMEILIDLQIADTTLEGLSAQQLETIEDISKGQSGSALAAEAVLYELYGTRYHHPIYPITGQSAKRYRERPVQEDVQKVKVFPNPASDHVHIVLADGGQADNLLLEVYDIQGRRVLQHSLANGAAYHTIKLELPAGLYLYRVSTFFEPIQSGKLSIVK